MRLTKSTEKCMIMKKAGERGDEEGGCRTVCYSPARVVVYRLLKIAKKCRNGVRKEEFHLRDQETQESRKSDDRPRRINVSGLQSHEASFNLAAGLGLLSLIAASKTELDKTVELRKQMEVYLESFKDENQSKVTTPKSSHPEIAYAAVSTAFDDLSNYSMDDHGPSLSQQESGNTVENDMPCNMHQHHKEESVEGIGHFEEELAAELDRLEFDVEAEGCVQTGESSEIQADATEVRSENTATESVNMSHGEVIDPQYVDNNNSEFNGVPPLELERRLHEVLETRQDERIKELEAHLERMNRRLQEKEVEVAWWKDTAKLISQQLPESSRALR